jgi:hypothetical protein
MSKTPARKPRARKAAEPTVAAESPAETARLEGKTDPLLNDAVIEEPDELPQPIIDWQPTHSAEHEGGGLSMPSSRALGAGAAGMLAFGALALGALAIGAVAIGRLSVGRARMGRLEIDHLVVGKISVLKRR